LLPLKPFVATFRFTNGGSDRRLRNHLFDILIKHKTGIFIALLFTVASNSGQETLLEPGQDVQQLR
jgi:hypothetical protein